MYFIFRQKKHAKIACKKNTYSRRCFFSVINY
nr:MAG TPA: hypothetical protein [Caudoviricetes sp.]